MNAWLKLTAKVNALSLRERILVFVTGLLIVFMPIYSFALEPMQISIKNNQDNISKLEIDLVRVKGEVEVAHIRLQRDPNKALQKELAILMQAMADADKQLKDQTVDLIPADRMASVLERMLTRSEQLTLVKLESIAPKPLLEVSNKLGDEINLYQHGLKLVFEGSYFPIQKYLTSLENLEEKFYWRLLDYRVTEYPKASVELEIYTLSTNKDFLRG